MGRTGIERAPSAPATSGWSAVGIAAAYAAAIVAFAYALVSLYWAVGGHGLVSTVGGYVEQFARRGGAVPMLVASRRPWRRWLVACWRCRWSVPGGG
jgi:hypothetical protein